jgi:hypothetical protein
MSLGLAPGQGLTPGLPVTVHWPCKGQSTGCGAGCAVETKRERDTSRHFQSLCLYHARFLMQIIRYKIARILHKHCVKSLFAGMSIIGEKPINRAKNLYGWFIPLPDTPPSNPQPCTFGPFASLRRSFPSPCRQETIAMQPVLVARISASLSFPL